MLTKLLASAISKAQIIAFLGLPRTVKESKNQLIADLRFSFHVPYPIGKAWFPPPEKLPQVVHMEQEGIFRFGRALLAHEKITHREQDVRVYLEQALLATKKCYYLDTEYAGETTAE